MADQDQEDGGPFANMLREQQRITRLAASHEAEINEMAASYARAMHEMMQAVQVGDSAAKIDEWRTKALVVAERVLDAKIQFVREVIKA